MHAFRQKELDVHQEKRTFVISDYFVADRFVTLLR